VSVHFWQKGTVIFFACSGSDATSNDLLSAIHYPDMTTGKEKGTG
jgi:hypothetical protein